MEATATQQAMSANAKRRMRVIVETYYDVQNVRMATDNRILQYSDHEGLVSVLGEVPAAELQRTGQAPYKAEIRKLKLSVAELKELKEIGTEKFLKIHSEAADKLTFLAGAKMATDELEDKDYHRSVNKLMADQEKILMKQAKAEIKDHPLWDSWLKDVLGIGECFGGGLISRIDIHQCNTVSQLWKYAGQAVVMDSWKCYACDNSIPHHPSLLKRGVQAVVKCPKCGNGMAAIGHADRRVRGEKLTYNPELKKLCWKISGSFLKVSAKKSGYRQLYDKFRAEIEAKIASKGGFCHKTHYDGAAKKKVIPCFDAHKLAMARRKTVKVFLAHVYQVWRELEGLPTENPWIFWDGSGHQNYMEPFKA